MNRDQIIAQALVSWIEEKLDTERDIAREGLPPMDVDYFFKQLAQVPAFNSERFSIAIVGFDYDSTALQSTANSYGLKQLIEVADDLNTAAYWRNSRRAHPRILALARGRHPGVHTLKHFAQGHSRELARAVLEWASNSDEFISTAVQHDLLHDLAQSTELGELRSLETVADFLSSWSKYRQESTTDAPRQAISNLGLLSDPALFSNPKEIEQRLVKNMRLVREILDTSSFHLRKLRAKIEKYNNEHTRTDFLSILDRVDTLRLEPTPENRASLTFEEAKRIFKPPADKTEQPECEEEQNEGTEESEEIDLVGITAHSADALLDNKQEDLERAAEALEEAWQQADEEDAVTVEGEVQVNDETIKFSFNRDPTFLDWLHTYCTLDVWGGLIESKEPSLKLALSHHTSAIREPLLLNPDEVVVIEGKSLSMNTIFSAFDEELDSEDGPSLGLSKRWERFCELRRAIIPHLDYLVHFPLNWLSGKPELATLVEEYLSLSSEIYHLVQENYHTMSDISEGWARAILEGLLTLDILQVRLELEDGRLANKAVMLPTHPLHIWRYQRLTSILRGLGERITLADRKAIRKEVMRPEHFLSVLGLGSIPDGRGAKQLLPIANEINGLATFENLDNAYSGQDGIEELTRSVDRFTILARHHARPLRLAIVNPPEPGMLLVKIVNILKHRRKTTLPSLRVEFYCTPAHSQRIQLAMRLTDERELLEEQLANGRLQFKAHETPQNIEDLIAELKTGPFHIVAIFDEATIHIRRGGFAQLLPMSPFCVCHRIRYERFENRIHLEPTSDEPPFSEYIQLINEAERGQRDSSPHAWADAEGLRRTVDELLQGDFPPARWVFLADRALPTEGGMTSVRLIHTREGQRQVLLAAADYEQLAALFNQVFERRYNLSLSTAQLQQLLKEGVDLIGTGFLDLIRPMDGQPDLSRVQGLAGMLLAARDYRLCYPDSLLVAVDSNIARLWLRLGLRNDPERCDLLALRKEENQFVIECIEVKTTGGKKISGEGTIITHAREQIRATLDACSQAIPDSTTGLEPLSGPRCEMLKEVFVRACQARGVPPELLARWSDWLKQLMGQEDEQLPVQYKGIVVRVLLGSNKKVSEKILEEDPFIIKSRNLTEKRLQYLIELSTSTTLSGRSTTEDKPTVTKKTSIKREKTSTPDSSSLSVKQQRKQSRGAPPMRARRKTAVMDKPPKSALVKTAARKPSLPSTPSVDATPSEAIPDDLPWPPKLNELGLIGQDEAVEQLIAQVDFSRAAGKRFPDKLLVGSAGVGKSSLARAISKCLLEEDEILFNGADLRVPSMIVTRLKQLKKIPARSRRQCQIEKCLIFIDEVHAIKSPVATTLLGAMDDQRITTIDGCNYDFNQVIFILATTDPGVLSEAFNTRPDKTYLRPYTLSELAGIVWWHGKQNLEGHELSREVCYEIAARMRCQPRRAVRALTQMLIPNFFQSTHKKGEKINYQRIASAITQPAVAEWFDGQGTDLNGLDGLARNYLGHLARNGATSGERLRQALGITNRNDFIEVDEYLVRLGLVTVSPAGRSLKRDGSRYLKTPFDLRDRISRQI